MDMLNWTITKLELAVNCWSLTGILGYIIRKYFGESVELPDVK
jgi:hypothetical protein